MAADKYTKTAITLHWVIAVAILAQLGTGIVMGYKLVDKSLLFPMFQFHKSLGLTVLVLSLFRLFWRMAHRPPPLPVHMPLWEIWAARLSHYALYFLMIAVPFSGWVIVSSSSFSFPTEWFWTFTWPHLPGFENMDEGLKGDFNEWSESLHIYMAYATLALLFAHVGAALKHHFHDKDEVFHHMIPAIKPKTPIAIIALLLLSFPVQAADWIVDPAKSAIAFSGENAGTAFTGKFEKWDAQINFEEAKPETSSVKVTIDTASAKTGTKTFDSTLPQKDWFDVKNHPQAMFESSEIKSLGDHKYEAKGKLTLKDVTQDFTLPFTLTTSDGKALMTSETKIDRVAFNIGKSSDSTGEWVSKEIGLKIKVEAAQK